mmetsp:Transcript_45936/g.74941  ORF Transcript_45936/g.74941 Transcript_45936/m.74941 type:complete len:379 (+) Transcript_45936:222-1358(+)
MATLQASPAVNLTASPAPPSRPSSPAMLPPLKLHPTHVKRIPTPKKLRSIAVAIGTLSFICALVVVISISTLDWIVLNTSYVSQQKLEMKYGLLRTTELGAAAMYSDCDRAANEACERLFIAGWAAFACLAVSVFFSFWSFTAGIALHLELFGACRMAWHVVWSSLAVIASEIAAVAIWRQYAFSLWSDLSGAELGFSFILACGGIGVTFVTLILGIVSIRWAKNFEINSCALSNTSKGLPGVIISHLEGAAVPIGLQPLPSAPVGPGTLVCIVPNKSNFTRRLSISPDPSHSSQQSPHGSPPNITLEMDRRHPSPPTLSIDQVQPPETAGANYVLELERRLAGGGLVAAATDDVVLQDFSPMGRTRGNNAHATNFLR